MVKLKHPQPVKQYDLSQINRLLPQNYNFELQKTLTHIERNKRVKERTHAGHPAHTTHPFTVGLQFPDGLLKYAPIISDCIEAETSATAIILADVVYGACCVSVDPFFDLVVHYGHSCIVPEIKNVLYVFVDVWMESEGLERIVERMLKEDEKKSSNCCSSGSSCNSGSCNCSNSGSCNSGSTNCSNSECTNCSGNSCINCCSSGSRESFTSPVSNNWTVLGTIQFRQIVHKINSRFNFPTFQAKPLSVGEVLGCTSPKIERRPGGARDHPRNVIFVSDGRFHLESLMISNPSLTYYRYCPFNKRMYTERYDYARMALARRNERAKFLSSRAVGLINGTLGTQGSSKILSNVVGRLSSLGKRFYVFNFEEIKESNLAFDFVDGFVQICCPRLSIDWGSGFDKFMLCGYEVFNEEIREMDFYGAEERPWNNAKKRGEAAA